MDAVTYPQEEIIRTTHDLFVPLKIDVTVEKELIAFLKVELTPTVLATDSKLKSFYRWEGFIRPEEFKQTLRLMRAIFDMERRKYDSAIDLFSQILDESFGCAATAESLYHLGVTRYKKSGDFQQAVEQWRRLKLFFPNHPLIKKVDYAL
jgi:tetratricopeptide (TPR) repeat protein